MNEGMLRTLHRDDVNQARIAKRFGVTLRAVQAGEARAGLKRHGQRPLTLHTAVDKSLHDAVNAEAVRAGMTAGAVVRRALMRMLERGA